jgi:hypothetical protein
LAEGEGLAVRSPNYSSRAAISCAAILRNLSGWPPPAANAEDGTPITAPSIQQCHRRLQCQW